MPTVLGRKYDIFWRGKYPQMLNEDFPIWKRYLKAHGEEYLWFYYNVYVDGQLPTNPNIPEKLKEGWWKSTAKRIDAIGEKENEIVIIEITTRPGFRAIGQILTYRYLWNKDPLIRKPVRNLLVGHMLDDDLEAVLSEMGIDYIEI